MSRSASPRCIPSLHTRVYLFSANRWDLVGAAPNRTEVSNSKQWASRAARSDASSKAFMALFRGFASLFIRTALFFLLSFSLRSSHPFSSPLRSSSSSFRSRICFPFPISRYTYYYDTRCRAITLIPRIALTVRRILHLHYHSATATVAQTANLEHTRWLFVSEESYNLKTLPTKTVLYITLL